MSTDSHSDKLNAFIRDVQLAIHALDMIHREVDTSKEKALVHSKRDELVTVLDAFREIKNTIGSGVIPKITDTSTDAQTGTDTPEDIDGVMDNIAKLTTDIKNSMSTDMSTMIGRITKIEDDIEKLQTLLTEINQRVASSKGKVGSPGVPSMFARLQDTINVASQVAGTVTIRGVRHTVETYVAEGSVRKMFADRFKNLSATNLIIRVKTLVNTNPEGEGKDTVHEYKKRTKVENADELHQFVRKQKPSGEDDEDEDSSKDEPVRFISLIPTAPLSIGMSADKSFSVVLQDVVDEVQKGVYTYKTHDPVTYEEIDTGEDIKFDMTRSSNRPPSRLEDAIVRLSLEYLDVIRKYLLATNDSTSGYVAILPSSVFGIRFAKKLFQYKGTTNASRYATGGDNKKSMGDLVDAYHTPDIKQQIPHIAYIHTYDIDHPVISLNKDSEWVRPHNLNKTIGTLGQLYVRFARKSSRHPVVKIGLQDTLIGTSKVHDFPNIQTSCIYREFKQKYTAKPPTAKPPTAKPPTAKPPTVKSIKRTRLASEQSST